jgi:hypothetical protein
MDCLAVVALGDPQALLYGLPEQERGWDVRDDLASGGERALSERRDQQVVVVIGHDLVSVLEPRPLLAFVLGVRYPAMDYVRGAGLHVDVDTDIRGDDGHHLLQRRHRLAASQYLGPEDGLAQLLEHLAAVDVSEITEGVVVHDGDVAVRGWRDVDLYPLQPALAEPALLAAVEAYSAPLTVFSG